MPIYEYRCEKGHTFEVLQSMSDDALTACEVCGAPVQKILHAPAVHFKGSGFYNTDYGKGGKSKSAAGSDSKKEKADSNGSSDSSGSSDSASKKTEPAKPGSAKKSD